MRDLSCSMLSEEGRVGLPISISVLVTSWKCLSLSFSEIGEDQNHQGSFGNSDAWAPSQGLWWSGSELELKADFSTMCQVCVVAWQSQKPLLWVGGMQRWPMLRSRRGLGMLLKFTAASCLRWRPEGLFPTGHTCSETPTEWSILIVQNLGGNDWDFRRGKTSFQLQ